MVCATDDGLVDVRPTVELWGLGAGVERWRELRLSECNTALFNLEISEMVLAEDWPARLKELDIQNMNDVTSNVFSKSDSYLTFSI